MSTVYADDITDEVSRRVAGYHNSARIAVSKAAGTSGGGIGGMGGGSGGAYESALSPGETSNFGFHNSAEAAKQYEASKKDWLCAAIRPIAVRVAGQPIRVGAKPRKYGAAGGKIRTKSSKRKHSSQSSAELFNFQYRNSAPYFIRSISEGIDVEEDHPLLDALANPNPYMNQCNLMQATAWSMMATGQAIWILDSIVNDDGNLQLQIWYFPIHWVQPIHTDAQPFVAWRIRPPGSTGDEVPPVPASLVVHFFNPDPANPTAAFSQVQGQARSVNVDSEILEAQQASMRNSSRPSVVITMARMEPHPDLPGSGGRPQLTNAQRQQILQSFRAAYKGAVKHGEPIVVDGIVESVTPFLPKPAELDFTGSSKLTKDRIFQGLGVNPIVAGQIENANRASSYVAQENFCTNVLNPLITNISETMTRRFGQLFGTETEKFFVWLEEAKPSDIEMDLAFMQFLAMNGWLRGNEARERCDLPPDPTLNELPKPVEVPAASGPQRGGAVAAAGSR